jgi:mannose-6-phosphate isomerase-like protein (cupin superfamily)
MTNLPRKINADARGEKYLRLLGGPPETVTLRSGKVTLQPGETVGEHSTDDYEEMIIVLEGEGTFLYGDSGSLGFDANSVMYCPPHTTHNIRNTGATPLQYIYVVGKAITGQS